MQINELHLLALFLFDTSPEKEKNHIASSRTVCKAYSVDGLSRIRSNTSPTARVVGCECRGGEQLTLPHLIN